MSEQKAQMYDQLLSRYQKIENQINAIPQLSIEEQSKCLDINEKYSTQNQNKVNGLRGELSLIQNQLKSIM